MPLQAKFCSLELEDSRTYAVQSWNGNIQKWVGGQKNSMAPKATNSNEEPPAGGRPNLALAVSHSRFTETVANRNPMKHRYGHKIRQPTVQLMRALRIVAGRKALLGRQVIVCVSMPRCLRIGINIIFTPRNNTRNALTCVSALDR